VKVKGLLNIASNSVKATCGAIVIGIKISKSWLNHQGIEEEITVQNVDTIKNIIPTKYKKKL